MSRKPSTETTERLKPGKPSDSGQTSSSSHVRSSVSFLNPDIVPGSTHLERAPSLNRLHAQSSTETSGLGETVTSGFSSQESVLSYVGDERERSGVVISYGERSRRRTGGSPGSGRGAVLDHDHSSKEVSPNIPSGLSFQQISKYQRQQDQYLTIPQQVPRIDRQDIQTRHDNNVHRSKYDPHSVDTQQNTGRREKHSRDTGGKSLTPQEAKEVYEQRQRRNKQGQRKRDSENYSSSTSLETKRPGTSSSNSDKPRSGSSHRQRETEHFDSPNAKDNPRGAPSADDKRRTSSPGNTRDVGRPEYRSEDYRQNSRGDRLDNSSASKSKQRSKEAATNRIVPRPGTKSGSRDSLELSSTSIPTPVSVRSEVTSKTRERGSSDINSSDHEKRSSSRSRDENKTQSSSSSKSVDSQVSVIKPYNSKHNTPGDSATGNVKSQDINKSALPDSSQPISDRRRQNTHPSTSDVSRSLPKFPDSDTAGSKSSLRNYEEGKEYRGQLRNVHGLSEGTRSGSKLEGRGSYHRQKSDPLKAVNSSRDARDAERSKSLDNNKVDGGSLASGSKEGRYQRKDADKYGGGKTDGAVESGSAKIYSRAGRESAGQLKVKDVQDIDLGPVLIRRTDHNPRDPRAYVVGERSGEGSRPKHSRERNIDAGDLGRPRDRPTTRSSHSRSVELDNNVIGHGESMQGRLQTYRVSDIDRSSQHCDNNLARNDEDEEDNEMNYERLFHQARGGMNGAGGAGSRPNPAALDRIYSTPPSKLGGSPSGQGYSNISRSTKPPQSSDVPSLGVSSSVPPPTRASYTKFQVPQPPTTTPAITVKLTSPSDQEQELGKENELERRDSRSSNKSYTSKSSGFFLGTNTSSAWAKWSRERRASYRKRIEKMEQTETQAPVETARVSTPIKKARQEGLKFLHPDLEANYLSEEDLNELRRHKQQQVHAMRVIEKSRRNKFRSKSEVKMTPEEWHMLQDFWNSTVFVRARFIGILVSLVAFIFMILSVTNHSWLKHNTWNLTVVEGLWMNCTQSSVIPNAEQTCHASSGRSWQNAVIGLMLFATALGFLASVLSVCGVFTNPLPKKIYYFHSAGEVFFICAISASVALFVFPIAVEVDNSINTHTYGTGYGLGWAGTLFFFAAAVCLSLDDLVRESSRTKCCRWCWRGKHSDRNELRQV